MPPPRMKIISRGGSRDEYDEDEDDDRDDRRGRRRGRDEDDREEPGVDPETVAALVEECDALRAQNDGLRAQLIEALAGAGLTEAEIVALVPEAIPTTEIEIAVEPEPAPETAPPPRAYARPAQGDRREVRPLALPESRGAPGRKRSRSFNAAKVSRDKADPNLGELVHERRTPSGGTLRVFRKSHAPAYQSREEWEAERAQRPRAAPRAVAPEPVHVNGRLARRAIATAPATAPAAPAAAPLSMAGSVAAAIAAARARSGEPAAAVAASASPAPPETAASGDAVNGSELDYRSLIEMDLPEPEPRPRRI